MSNTTPTNIPSSSANQPSAPKVSATTAANKGKGKEPVRRDSEKEFPTSAFDSESDQDSDLYGLSFCVGGDSKNHVWDTLKHGMKKCRVCGVEESAEDEKERKEEAEDLKKRLVERK